VALSGSSKKRKWAVHARLNGIKHGGFEPRRTPSAFTEAQAARNTVRLKGCAEVEAAYVVD
jgi:hypothetical protein